MTATQIDTTAVKADSSGRPLRLSGASPIAGALASADHKATGRLFIGGGLAGLVAGLVLSVLSAFEAIDTSYSIVKDGSEAAQLWSAGRELALFAGIVPMLVGLAIYIVPLQVGASSLAFARGAAAAFWTWAFASGLFVASYLRDGGPAGGKIEFIQLWSVSLAVMLAAIVWALLCVVVTISGARTKGMDLGRAPLTTWSFFVFSLLGLVSLPIMVAELLLSYLRVRFMHIGVDEASAALPDEEKVQLVIDASAELVGVTNGFAFAPSIYWLLIPVLGVSAEIIAVHSAHKLKSRQLIMLLVGVFGLLTFGADTVGFATVRDLTDNNAIRVLALLAAPLPVIAILGAANNSLRKGVFKLRTPLVASLAAGAMALFATVVGLLSAVNPLLGFWENLAPNPVDYQDTLPIFGTSYHEAVRALVIGAVVLTVLAGLHHWAQKLWGRSLSEGPGLLATLAVGAGSILWAAGELAAGIDGQILVPANALESGDSAGFKTMAFVGLAVLAAGVIITAADVVMTLLTKPATGDANPWGANTLEWATQSPPNRGNFPAPPVVDSAYPLESGELTFDIGTGELANAQLGSGTSKDGTASLPTSTESTSADSEPAEVTE